MNQGLPSSLYTSGAEGVNIIEKFKRGPTYKVAWSGDKLDQEGGAHREAVGEAGRGPAYQGDIVCDSGLVGADDHLDRCVNTDIQQ